MLQQLFPGICSVMEKLPDFLSNGNSRNNLTLFKFYFYFDRLTK